MHTKANTWHIIPSDKEGSLVIYTSTKERKLAEKQVAGRLLIPCPISDDVWWAIATAHGSAYSTGYGKPVGLVERTENQCWQRWSGVVGESQGG